jgi:hypothetical protein
MVSIEFADEPQGSGADDLEPIPEQGPLYNYEVKAEAIANDVDFSEDGIMDALKKGNLVRNMLSERFKLHNIFAEYPSLPPRARMLRPFGLWRSIWFGL